MTPAPIKSRLRGHDDPTEPSDVESAEAPSQPAPEAGTDGATGEVEDWALAGFERSESGWQMAVRIPAAPGSRTMTLVLVGRKSLRELLVDMSVDDDTATAELTDAVLTRFAGDIADIWIEPHVDDKPAGWKRVAASPHLILSGPDAAARWYATVKGNVSVTTSTPAVEPYLASVVLAGLTEDDAGARLTLSRSRSNEPLTPELLLVGKTTRRVVTVDLTPADGQLVAVITAEDLAAFGRELVEAFTAVRIGTYTTTRTRVAVGTELPRAVRPGTAWRLGVTENGHLVARRKTSIEVIAESGAFDVDHYRTQVPELSVDADPIEHYVTVGAASGLNPSTMFDSGYYRTMNPDVRSNPLEHYCTYGWKELRNPSPLFDTWWYWSKHLDPADEGTSPLAHYENVGKQQGLSTRPSVTPSRALGLGSTLPAGRAPRRVCLFAAYDADGIVDDYAVAYVRELARHADVYYWADCEMPQSELDKLAGITKQAWAVRHGEYDFGSYARLVDAVSWETIEQYDELLLVNDSCYLLRPLDDVFDRMDARPCDWWGLQATKGLAQTRSKAVNQFRDPIPMSSVRGAVVDAFERDYTYDFHVGSYFLAYRKPVIEDPEFRRYVGAITLQRNKRNIVKKYEIGLTRWLIQHGHQLDTYVQKIYPFHPLFSEWHFRMLDEGFPLFKRYLLTENHYHVPNLWQWKDRVRERVPGADVAMFERNLQRICEPGRLERTLGVGGGPGATDLPVPDHLLSDAEFVEADRTSPKHASWWVFPVCAFSETFSGNERAIFEEVKDDPSVRKIVLTRSKDVHVDGMNVEVLPLESPEGQHRLLHSGTILIKHSRARNVRYPVSSELHNLIQVWHGIPFKRIGYASSDFLGVLEKVVTEQDQYRAVISSSKVDSLAMTAAFYPLTIHQVWNTGLPRNDFILREETTLPEDLQSDLARVRELLDGRRLVLFMPTFRNSQSEGAYRFAPEEIERLRGWLEANGAVLGVREHMADTARQYGSQLAEIPAVDLSDAEFPNVEVLYRASDALVTDYSSAFIDYMLTGKPAISFAYDYEAYLLERGGFYDLEQIFPGPICKTFEEFATALDTVFERDEDATYAFKQRLFFDHVDDGSSARVVEKIRDLSEAHGVGKWPGERIL